MLAAQPRTPWICTQDINNGRTVCCLFQFLCSFVNSSADRIACKWWMYNKLTCSFNKTIKESIVVLLSLSLSLTFSLSLSLSLTFHADFRYQFSPPPSPPPSSPSPPPSSPLSPSPSSTSSSPSALFFLALVFFFHAFCTLSWELQLNF